jgi:AcrR family transcriptional regulator
MSNAAIAESRRENILAAAQEIFIHYGFARASLDLIAREAGISRTGLYHHFANKDEIFREVSNRLHEGSLRAAEQAAAESGAVEERLAAVLRAKVGAFFELLGATRHGDEILDQGNRLCGDEIAEGSRRYRRCVAKLFRDAERAGQIDLQSAGMSADTAAAFVVDGAYGLQGQQGGEVPTPAQFDKRLGQLARIVILGFGGKPG